ncbi:MAG TPA: hypothetical protein VL614_30075 [Acetobacteraceae bacterium]|jgi:hypothetical protein|nr:hypothetical protein [Acetobacteraceae bacterium]
MAGKNDFRELKLFGEKELKFKQGVHMEGAYKGRLLSAPVYSKVNEGACAALTMEWLKAKLSEGKYPGAFNPAPGVPAAQNLMHQVQVWHAAQFQVAYENSGSSSHLQALKTLAAEYGLEVCELKNQPWDHFIVAFSKAADRMAEGKGAYCSCTLTDERSGSECHHAVGIAKLADGIRFFDANIGAYKFANHYKFTQFYEAWGQLYRSKLKYHMKQARAFPVSNDPAKMPAIVRQ